MSSQLYTVRFVVIGDGGHRVGHGDCVMSGVQPSPVVTPAVAEAWAGTARSVRQWLVERGQTPAGQIVITSVEAV